jgi:hypothetical protein
LNAVEAAGGQLASGDIWKYHLDSNNPEISNMDLDEWGGR